MTKLQECLASNLKLFRKMRHMTQEQLAEKAGTSTTYIGTIEIGQKFPSKNMIEKISNALGVESIQLFQTSHTLPIKQKAFDKSSLSKALMKNIKDAVESTLKNC